MKRKNKISHYLATVCFTFGLQTAHAGPLRIMSLGDSITAGYYNNNYRSQLADKLLSVSCDADFVGVYNDTLPTSVSSYSAIWGIAATTVDEYYISSWMEDVKPDVVLMLLGGNDIRLSIPPADIIISLQNIINKIRDVSPEAKIFVGVYPDILKELPNMSKLNAAIPSLAELSTDKSPIYIVNHSTDYDIAVGADTTDTVHANTNGNAKYANNWFKALINSGLCSSEKIVYNVSLNKPVSTPASPYGYGSPSLAVNNLVNDESWERMTINDSTEQSLTIDLQGKYSLNNFELSYANTHDYQIDVKENLEDDWKNVVNENNNNQRRMTHPVSPVNANYVRLTLNPPFPNGLVAVKEFRVMGTPISIP